MIRGSEVEKLVTLGYFGSLELVPLGHVGTLDGLISRSLGGLRDLLGASNYGVWLNLVSFGVLGVVFL